MYSFIRIQREAFPTLLSLVVWTQTRCLTSPRDSLDRLRMMEDDQTNLPTTWRRLLSVERSVRATRWRRARELPLDQPLQVVANPAIDPDLHRHLQPRLESVTVLEAPAHPVLLPLERPDLDHGPGQSHLRERPKSARHFSLDLALARVLGLAPPELGKSEATAFRILDQRRSQRD
jgi:hypothetical protein